MVKNPTLLRLRGVADKRQKLYKITIRLSRSLEKQNEKEGTREENRQASIIPTRAIFEDPTTVDLRPNASRAITEWVKPGTGGSTALTPSSSRIQES